MTLPNLRGVIWGPLYVDRPHVSKYVGTRSDGMTFRVEVDGRGDVEITTIDRAGEAIAKANYPSQAEEAEVLRKAVKL